VDIDELASLRPGNIEEALDAMREGLHFYHETHDRRAIFLRLYYKMTLEVYAAMHGCGEYKGRRVFLDGDWIHRLSGLFSSLYFASLDAPRGDRAWHTAHRVAKQRGSSVVQNALLGINAHINFDLPRAVAANLDPAELSNYEIMQRRKFDHDQVNNLLVRTVNPVQKVLAKNYEPGIGVVDLVTGGFDERACAWLLRTYREQVWWNALAFAAAPEGDERQTVRNKLEWESNRLAKKLVRSPIWRAELAVNYVVRPLLVHRWAAVPLERRCHDHRRDQAEGPLGEIGCSAAPV
jgi:Family of unknown function (DUF5995)